MSPRLYQMLERNRQRGLHQFQFGGLIFAGREDVFSPAVFEDSFVFTERLAMPDIDAYGKEMLEIGCGTGLTGLYLLKKRGLRSLDASDISLSCLACTRDNSHRLGIDIAARVRLFESDVFDNLPAKQYDIIYWNHPWTAVPQDYAFKDTLERSVFDKDYSGLEKFFRDVGSRRRPPAGRIFLGYSDRGDETVLQRLAGLYGYNLSELLRKKAVEAEGPEFLLYELLPIPRDLRFDHLRRRQHAPGPFRAVAC